MVRRSAIPPTGFNEAFGTAGDWHLYIDILLKGGEIRYINKVLARYRRHQTNTTGIGSPLNRLAVLDALNTSNWVMVNYPTYLPEALASYARHVRLLRRFGGGYHYQKALVHSIKINFTFPAAIALLVFWITFGRVRL